MTNALYGLQIGTRVYFDDNEDRYYGTVILLNDELEDVAFGRVLLENKFEIEIVFIRQYEGERNWYSSDFDGIVDLTIA